MFEHYGLIEGRDFDEMLDLAAGFLACGDRLPAGKRVGDLHVLRRRRRLDGGCLRARPGSTCRCSTTTTRKAIDVHLPSYGTSQNPVNSTAQGVHKLGYAAFARLAAQSPLIDGVIVVVTARRSAFLEGDRRS